MRNEEETMIVHKLYMVMILELEWVKVERMTDIFKIVSFSQQLTSFPTTELHRTFDMNYCGFFEEDALFISSRK